MPELPPIIQQYLSVKAKHPGTVLLYRVGDFYESYLDDAKTVSAALNITLTKYGQNKERGIPMCGIPHHAFDSYIPKLVAAGYSVAVCDQLETPEEAKERGGYKAMIRRDVVRIITPGTLTEDNLIGSSLANWLAALDISGGEAGIAFVDISTGELQVKSCPVSDMDSAVSIMNPAEIIIADDLEIPGFVREHRNKIKVKPRGLFRTDNIRRFFGTDNVGEFSDAEKSAMNAALEYISATQMGAVPKIRRPSRIAAKDTLYMDSFSARNLEIFENLNDERELTLFKILDRTKTAAGRRLLRARLSAPLLDPGKINARLDEVDRFFGDKALTNDVRDILGRVGDIERIMSRAALGRAGPRDIYSLGASLTEIAAARQRLGLESKEPEIARRIRRTIVEDPPVAPSENFIRPGANATLDEYRALRSESAQIILELQARYAMDTQILALKIKYNNIFGYFIEVPTAKADALMQNQEFKHKQTLVNAVRFTTSELAELEKKIMSADTKKRALELEAFESLRRDVLENADRIAELSKWTAETDVSVNLAHVASANGYVRPVVDDTQAFEAKGGRHPVVEQSIRRAGGTFIPNDADFSGAGRIWLLTGPNMAGKSTFLRQNALLVVMAQAGSFVPAESFRLGIVDKLFSRVGASDNLAQGLSTFMVEMRETANILNQASERSFVILDEIGRGTATFDGLSIAWAVLEHLDGKSKCRGLFATHYHELNSAKLASVAPHTMTIKEYKGDIIFMHKVADGSSDRSYGIHVARLAGLPQSVVRRAGEILGTLESQPRYGAEEDLFCYASAAAREDEEDPEEPEAVRRLRELDPDKTSPKEALDFLYRIKKEIA
ncbi:MAG: DNA mismatch repair protein MutS [Rickettsiales bacterium]|jgi:DNA mismatch repair protein MutS|nr:DNA mismatch repair protein MutS [Rickettsiales bacterium]